MKTPNTTPPVWDFIVIGGGAAGFFSAITCAEALGGNAHVLILEKTAHVLGKVKISGGGRCNVTHACFNPKDLASYYPRGHKSLIGPFHRWGAEDTVQWFAQRGVELKMEPDGRIFPVTDNSQTIIDCLTQAATDAGVIVKKSTSVESIKKSADHFHLTSNTGELFLAKSILLATGGTRLAAGAKLAQSLGHKLTPNTPTRFAFNLTDPRIQDLPGISVPDAKVSALNLKSTGPLLITHHGFSGPAILKLSAWGAREFQQCHYSFSITVNWVPNMDVATKLTELRQSWGKRQITSTSPFKHLPKRLWKKLCAASNIPTTCLWSQLTKASQQQLTTELSAGEFQVSGKSINKDEFVTCGGVPLKEVTLKTMESKIVSGLYFAGEVLDIDGVTGGFNFQNAWTTGFLAGNAAAL